MNREVHVRICERLGVKFPGPTRQKRRVRPLLPVYQCPKFSNSNVGHNSENGCPLAAIANYGIAAIPLVWVCQIQTENALRTRQGRVGLGAREAALGKAVGRHIQGDGYESTKT
jgi:hypothetical protein